MIGEFREHLHTAPFKPFVVVMSGGQRYPVASADHAGFSPNGNRAVIWFDEGSVTISGLHIVAIEDGVTPKNGDGSK